MFTTTTTTTAANTTANNTNSNRSTRLGLVAGVLVAGISLVGLTACQVELPNSFVRATSATEIDKKDENRSKDHENETTTTETPDTSSTIPDSSAPPISLPQQSLPPIALPTPDTTVPAPATTIPTPLPVETPVLPVAIPAGALDLGDGVFVPVSAGWTGTLENGVVHLTDGTVEVLAQVVLRQPGESPQLIIDEYVAGFIDPMGTVSARPVTLRWSTEAPRPATEYGFFYNTFDPAAADGQGFAGGVSAFIRNDGLTLMLDVWAPAAVTGSLPDDSFNALIDSFLAAPEVAIPAPLAMVPDFRVTSASATALVGPIAGFTVAPGFTVEASTPEYALATSATSEIAVLRSSGIADQEDSLVNGMAVVLSLLPEAQFTNDEVLNAADSLGVAGSSISFTTPTRSGSVVVFFDTTTGNAYSIVSVSDGAPGTSADAAALEFMEFSMANSFANII